MLVIGLISFATLLLIAHLAVAGLYLIRLRRPAAPVGVIGTPRVTLLRPVCGLDPFDEETLRSSFHQDYPAYDVIFCAQSWCDPAVALVQRLIAEHPDCRAHLMVGYDVVTANPKLNNVWKGWNAAQTDWICITDSNLLLPPTYLSTVVGSWGPLTGGVSSPPVGTRPKGFAAHLECAFLNTNQALLQFGSASLGHGFAQGKTLFFNRPLLEHCGGLRALGQYLAEDVTATKLIREMGRVVTLTPLPFAQPIGQRTLRAVWNRQLRWSRVRRDGFPVIFVTEVLNGGLVPFGLSTFGCLIGGLDMIWTVGYMGLWYLSEILVARRAGWPMSVLDLAALVLRDLVLPMLWAATFLRRGFEWRGTRLAPRDQSTKGTSVPAAMPLISPAE